MLKPGHKTTEFAVTVLVALGSLAASLAGVLAPRYAAIASAVSVAAYSIARGLAKNGATRTTVPVVTAAPPAPPVQAPPQ
jgi:predicted acyltransferase